MFMVKVTPPVTERLKFELRCQPNKRLDQQRIKLDQLSTSSGASSLPLSRGQAVTVSRRKLQLFMTFYGKLANYMITFPGFMIPRSSNKSLIFFIQALEESPLE